MDVCIVFALVWGEIFLFLMEAWLDLTLTDGFKA